MPLEPGSGATQDEPQKTGAKAQARKAGVSWVLLIFQEQIQTP